MERDLASLLISNAIRWISTHALTWSATIEFDINEYADEPISTHALTWSATGRQVYVFDDDFAISTHALTWSATIYATIHAAYNQHFNSRAHVERDDMQTTLHKIK